MERNFLIVAADAAVREALANDLRRRGLTVTLAANGSEAQRVVRSVSVDRVLVESHLPDMTAEELRSRLAEIRPECRVLCLTSFRLVRNSPELLRFGADHYLLGTSQIFELLRGPGALDGTVVATAARPTEALLQVIDVLVGLLELEHRSFDGSSHHAVQLARATAEEMGADPDMVVEVVLGVLLRNLGRFGDDHAPPDGEAEREAAREQLAATERLLEHVDFPWKALPVIRHRHERYNGSGFPDGLRGREIPMGARIVAVVDAYVARTASSAGRSASDPEQALGDLVRRAGHEFDPEVVEAFHRVMDKRLAGRRTRNKPCVLIVDEREPFRRLLRMRLLNEGFEVDEATAYEPGLQRLLEQPPDLALIDVEADPNEAFQLLSELQQDAQLCRIPIAFLARRPDRVLRLRALRQGVDDFLLEGDDLEEILARIESILVRQAMRSAGESRRSRRGITGELENLSLPDIVQTLAIGMKTACVSLVAGDRRGKIWFENGAPKHATADDLVGESAFYEMVRWATGEFVIEHGLRCKQTSLSQDAMFLLMEGLRLMDESSGAHQAVS